ncbi:unnamed protein product [Ixodes hexagonus]
MQSPNTVSDLGARLGCALASQLHLQPSRQQISHQHLSQPVTVNRPVLSAAISQRLSRASGGGCSVGPGGFTGVSGGPGCSGGVGATSTVGALWDKSTSLPSIAVQRVSLLPAKLGSGARTLFPTPAALSPAAAVTGASATGPASQQPSSCGAEPSLPPVLAVANGICRSLSCAVNGGSGHRSVSDLRAVESSTAGALAASEARRRLGAPSPQQGNAHTLSPTTATATSNGSGPPTDPYGRRLPLSPAEVLKYYGARLNGFERSEVLQYREVWYLGLEASKIDADEVAGQNGGYDDENGSYIKVLHDHIAYRYEILEVIGKGSFGQVIRALDHKTNQHVALKIIRNKKRFHQQALIEVKILDHLTKKDQDQYHNVIHMFDYFYFRNHLCITFELMGMNLYELIKKNNYQGFSLNLIRRFAYSLVQCLRLLHREKIIHCDLKPENILLKQRGSSNIKVIDFGSSCFVHQRVYTYIQSRFYRSPEVILGLPYGTSIDMWSLGCILAELYTGFPLFPGENEADQLACIMEVLGPPPPQVMELATRRRLFFDSKNNPRTLTNSKGKKRKPHSKTLAAVLGCNDEEFVDFLSLCLEWNPETRVSPDDALRHAWLAGPKDSRQLYKTVQAITVKETETGTVSSSVSYKVYKCTKPCEQKLKDQRKTTASSCDTSASSEESHPLEDSGTFLPPIL